MKQLNVLAKWAVWMLLAAEACLGTMAFARNQDAHGKVQLWEGGPYWAETNIGAEEPWEYGLYFWWGDTVGSLSGNFSFTEANAPTYGKDIDTLWNEGWIVAGNVTDVLAPAHDAAQVQWGGGWRMPTEQELCDLVKCDWEWTTLNSVNGIVFRGRGAFADASIFLPVAESCDGGSLNNAGGHGSYWSSEPYVGNDVDSNYDSEHLEFAWRGDDRYAMSLGVGHTSRGNGFFIRPVQERAEDQDSCWLHLHRNGWKATQEEADRCPPLWFEFGKGQKLPARPFERGDCTFYGWSVGTPEYQWDEVHGPFFETGLVEDGCEWNPSEGDWGEWFSRGWVKQVDGKCELDLYGVWGTQTTCEFFFENAGGSEEESPLSAHMQVLFDDGAETAWHRGGDAVDLLPGWHSFIVRADEGYEEYVAGWRSAVGGNVRWDDDRKKAEFYIPGTYDGPRWGGEDPSARLVLRALLMPPEEAGRVRFACTNAITELQRKTCSDFPAFDLNKIRIRLRKLEADGTEGKWIEAWPWGTGLALPPGTYRVEFGYAEKYWALSKPEEGWPAELREDHELDRFLFTVEAGQTREIPLCFRPFGAAQTICARVRFDGAGGRPSFGEMWYRFDENLNGWGWYDTDIGFAAKLPTAARTGGWTFTGWFRETTGGKALDLAALEAWLNTKPFSLTVHARWAKTKYKVAYNPNGGAGAMAPQTFTYGQALKLRKNAYRKNGCTFMGWATNKTGKVVYKDQQSVKNLRTDGGTTTLYAKWAKEKYKVAFNANGGKGKMAVQTVTYGKTVKLAKNAFAFDGGMLLGWATSKSGPVVYKNAQAVKNLRTDGKTTTLYAKWAKKNYKVAFNANGGKGSMAVQSMTYGKAVRLRKNAFKRSGWTFLGWATSRTGKVVYKNAQAVKNLRTDGKTTTLFAKWAKTNYKVAFNANGGTGSMAAQTFAWNKAANLRKNAFKRAGWSFEGWSKTAGGAVAYRDQQAVKNLRSDGGTTTLFAKWKRDRYAIVLDPQGGEGGTAGVTTTYGGALPDITVPERKGWVFEGYYTATNGGGTQYYDASGAGVCNWNRTAATTLFAHWSGPVLFVDAANGNDANDGLLWLTAKASIQAAIDAAADGTRILVADGVYEPISTVDDTLYPDGKALEIVSLNGAETTIIDGSTLEECDHVALLGKPGPGESNFEWTMSVLEGFTIQGGNSKHGAVGAGAVSGILRNCIVTDNRTDGAGGGVGFAICEGCVISGNKSTAWYGGGAFNCYLTDCIVENNEAAVFGGGTIGGTLVRCIIRGNWSGGDGGGVYASDLENCLVCGNSAETGGGIACETNGVYTNAIVNCTITGNTATDAGGGVTGPGNVLNSIVWGNSAPEAPDMGNCTAQFVCSPDAAPGNGNIAADPLFTDAAAGDFRLRAGSPCLDAGSDELSSGDTDLAGNIRIAGLAVDMGAYEYGGGVAKDAVSSRKGVRRAGGAMLTEETPEVLVTASGGENPAAVADGNEETAWTPGTAAGSWVVLTFSGPREIEDVEVRGGNLPEGTRFLFSEDADAWSEGLPVEAQYVWVLFPAADEAPVVKEILVTP